jgi:ElaB/YqjD/DUF883 family membrane-anchored ribosome-binding protein
VPFMTNIDVRNRAGSCLRALAIVAVAAALSSCSAAYYRALETFGIEKRDILVDRVEDARDAQNAAKDQFSSALEQYRSVVSIDGGDLEEAYDRINAAYERSDSRAQDVTNRVDAVQRVAEDLFDEWEDELDDYSDAGLRRQSERLLRDTRSQYQQVVSAMRRAESAMYPVLTLFQDQVLVLRHNLNARAIGALENELDSIERATAALIEEMERAIAEASQFIDSMV